MHIRKVIKLLYTILLFIAVIMLVPMVLALIWHETEAFTAFIKTIVLIIVFCFVLKLLSGKTDTADLSQRDGFIFTSFTWILATAFGALPLVFTKTLPHYSDAFFEIISGFTTTGASRLSDVESCYKSILFWRSLTNWLGGMGIVVLFIAILPAIGSGGATLNLMGAETVGPVKSKLTPKTQETALILWLIYVGITLLQTVLLMFGGCDLFNALTLSFSTVSTAGFSIKNASVAAYNSAYIDVIVTVFMIVASINFSLHFKLLHGKIREIIKDIEFKVYLAIIAAASLIGAFFLRFTGVYSSLATALRYMTFHVASVISTTGFSNTNFMQWPSFAVAILITMMFIGGCAGSTGGGIKMIRIHTLFVSARNSIRKKNHINSVYTLTINKEPVRSETIFEIFTFCVIYFVTWILATLIISVSGADIKDCLSTTLLTLGNIGLGFGQKQFAELPHWTNWVFSFLMLSGRLELMTVYVLFSRTFWKR